MATKKKAPAKSTPARKPAAKTVKKAPAKSSSKAKTTVQHPETAKSHTELSNTTSASEQKKGGFKIKKSYIILVVTILALAGLLYLTRSLFVAAVVNGQPISRLSVVEKAEKQAGKQVLAMQVRNKLIEQEARKQNVTVSEKEIDDEIKKLEENLKKQGRKLDQELTLQGLNQADLRTLIRLDKMVGKMVGKDIKITDQQVAQYIEQNKASFPEGQDENELKTSVKEQLKQQQLNEKVRVWLENLSKNAKINSFVDYYNPAEQQ